MKPLDPDAVPLPAFGLAEDYEALDTPEHAHARPQLLYCIEGSLRLHTPQGLALLPPQRAAWIGGGVPHAVRTGRPVRLRTVYFSEASPAEEQGLWVFNAPPLLREMAAQACAWGLAPPPGLDSFYQAFLALSQLWRADPLPLRLPAAQSAGLKRSLDWMLRHLDQPQGVESAARAGGMSLRSFQRRCREELGLGAQDWWMRARLLHALELLSDPSLQVLEVAQRSGYGSHAAFTRVFSRELGMSPSQWRGERDHDSTEYQK